MKKLILALIVLAVVGLTGYFIYSWYSNRLYNDDRFAWGNGRIEATEINISARLAGKVEKIKVLEGDRVAAGQEIVIMQTNVLVANLAQAEARRELAISAEESARAKVALCEATLERTKADLTSKQADLARADADYIRYKDLVARDAASQKHFQRAEASWLTAKADCAAAEAAIKEAEENVKMAKADAAGAVASIHAAEADISSIKADIDDSILRAPLAGRVQYRVAEPGEVLAAGGRAINMVDLTDVYMTFFLPEEIAGKVRVGADARIVLDVAPQYPLPAKITYVASVAQFTPKTVETKVERQKLMFRIKAHIDRSFLEQYIDLIKTGVPGVAWVKLDASAEWPEELQASKKAQEFAEKVRKELEARRDSEATVVQSQTAEMSRRGIENLDEFKKAGKGASAEKKLELKVKAAQQEAAKKEAAAAPVVEQVKAAEAARQAEVDKRVDAVKKMNGVGETAPAKGDAK